MLTTLAVALSLTVPYLPQTDALCGGAATAMVFRYWGDAHADVAQFAPLVDKHAGGIADDVLVKAIEDRGWHARRFVGSLTLLTEEIESGRPVLVLLADRGPVNHFLVVTGVETDAVIVHDPTWGPGRRIVFADFMKLWRPTNFWALEILPGNKNDLAGSRLAPAGVAIASADSETETNESKQVDQITPTVCDRLLNSAVERARRTPADAYQLLDDVRARCPGDAGPLREMAGVRFAERQWRDAASLAERATVLEPQDSYTWDLLAASRYLQDDLTGALRAWNQIGKPRINLVKIEGLSHARFQIVAEVLGLTPNTVLTERAFRLASRRLQDLPDRTGARLTFKPEADGFVTVTAAITERSGPPTSAISWTAVGVQAALDREARVGIPGSTGQAELWSASWRWWENRPRVGIAFAAPRTDRLRGVWRMDASWESQAYTTVASNPASPVSFDESRSHAALTVGDWLGPQLHYAVTAGVDVWRGRSYEGRTVLAGGSVERRWLDDRIGLSATATAWAPASFLTTGLRAAYQSSSGGEGWAYLADAGVARASDSAPLALWPGAGEGHSRELLLRAHPLLTSGAIDLEQQSVFGRTVVYTHAEAQRWVLPALPLRTAVAAFADLARATRRSIATPGAVTQVDIGAGLRLRIPGAAGTMRIDVAHGLNDGANAVTFAWQP